MGTKHVAKFIKAARNTFYKLSVIVLFNWWLGTSVNTWNREEGYASHLLI